MNNIKRAKEYITEAILQLLNKKKYEDITITDIAEKAGVTRITFYRNFESKDDIIKQYIQNIFSQYKWNDKLDVTYHRTINSSIQDNLNKEFQKIKKVEIEITNQDLIVKYKVEGNFDFSVVKEWEKMITIPKKAASYLKKNCIFMVNNETVNPFDE